MEEVKDIVAEQRWEPEGREFPGDTVTMYRQRWHSFLQIVGVAQDLLDRLQHGLALPDGVLDRMADLQHALQSHCHYYAPNGFLYVKVGEEYLPCEPFEPFPASGVYFVWRDTQNPSVHANYERIADIPKEDALLYARVFAHRERVIQALRKNWNAEMTLQDLADTVLAAIAQDEKAEEREEKR